MKNTLQLEQMVHVCETAADTIASYLASYSKAQYPVPDERISVVMCSMCVILVYFFVVWVHSTM